MKHSRSRLITSLSVALALALSVPGSAPAAEPPVDDIAGAMTVTVTREDATTATAAGRAMPDTDSAGGPGTLTEGFDDITSLPGSGWALINRSEPLGQTDWYQGNTDFFPAHEGAPSSYIAADRFNSGSNGTISNWLLTPEVTIVDGTVLTFATRTMVNSPFPDRLEVRASLQGDSTNVGTTAESVGDFTMLLTTINEPLVVGGYPQAWATFTLTVTEVPEPVNTGRFALRYFVTDAGEQGQNGFYIGIDTLSVSNPPLVDVDPESLAATLQQGAVEILPLNVANAGTETLEWENTDERFRGVAAERFTFCHWLTPAALMDPQGEVAYFGIEEDRPDPFCAAQESTIAKLTFDPLDFSFVDNVESLNVGPSVIDPQGAFAYFSFNTSPAQVLKFDLAEEELVDTVVLGTDEFPLTSAVIDPQGEFAYFGTFTSPGRVVKIHLATFERVGTLTLPEGMNNVFSGVMHPLGQFAYFGAAVGGAAGVVKVDLDDFEVVNADQFEGVAPGTPSSAAIDPLGEFVYFGMFSPVAWEVVKFDLEQMEEVSAIQGNDTAKISVAVMDPLGEYAYFATDTSPGSILKIDLSTFEEFDLRSLGGNRNVLSGVIDPAGTFAYFGARAAVVKIQFRLPACVLPDWLNVDPAGGSLPGGQAQTVDVKFDTTGLAPGEYTANVCVVSEEAVTPVVMVPVTLNVTDPPVLEFAPPGLAFGEVPVGTPSSPMTALLQNSGAGVAESLSFSVDNPHFDMDTSACGDSLPPGGSCPVHVTFTPTGSGPITAVLSADSGLVSTAELELSGIGIPPPAVIGLDPDSLAATLPSGTTTTRSLTVANLGGQLLGWQFTADAEVFDRVRGIELNDGEGDILSAVVDPEGEFAYFGTNTVPGRVVKVDLATFRQVDAIYLESGENGLLSAVIDSTGQFAYFGTDTAPGRVVKIDLATFERVGAITLEATQNGLWSAVIAPDGEHAYFGTNTAPGQVASIDLVNFMQDGAITLDADESFLRSAVIDPAGAFAYFGTDTFPGRVVRIDLDPFQRVDAVIGASGEDNLVAAVIDPAGTFAYFGTDTDPGRIVKIRLADMSDFGTITLNSGENQLAAAVIDPGGEFAYFGTQTDPGRVVKIDLDPFARSGAVTLNDGENDLWRAVIDPAGKHAYFATRDDPGRVVKVGLDRPDCALPTWLSFDPFSGSMPAGDARLVTVTFDATGLEAGDYSTSSCVRSNDHVSPLVALPTVMTVTPPLLPALSFDPPSLAFGDVEVETSLMLSSTLANTGTAAATVLSFSSPGNGFVVDASDCGSSLPTSESCTVVVTFAPTVPGPVDAVLEVGSAEGVSASLALAGRGVSTTEVFAPAALEVDYRALVASDGNRVFESGEIVDVAPAWRHDGLLEQSLSGEASAFTGPEGPDYDIVAGDAVYGSVLPAEIASCRDGDVCYQMGIGPTGVPRPALHWDAGFTESVSDESSANWSLHVGGSFTDVPPSDPFYPFVEALLHHAVSSGCGDSRFCPLTLTSRRHAAIFVLRALEGGDYAPPACTADSQEFADVPFDSPFCPWVEELFHRGGTAGCGGGNYCPGESLTRGQTAVLLLKSLEGPSYTPGACDGLFADVDCASPFAAWIEDLYDLGVTGGCSAEPLAYCPAQPLNRRQIAVFLGKAFGLSLYGP